MTEEERAQQIARETLIKRRIIGFGLVLIPAFLVVALLLVWPFYTSEDPPTVHPSPLLTLLSWGQGYNTHLNVNAEFRILLVVIVAGAIGASIQLIQSFSRYVGTGEFNASWFWWYLLRLPTGALLALAIYLVLRGGFAPGSPGSAAAANTVNVFGIAGLSLLAGLFSRQAVEKLGQIFDVMFDSDQNRSGELKGVSITPSKIKAGTTPVPDLFVQGTGLDAKTKVTVDGKVRTPSVDGTRLKVALTAEDIATKRTLQVVVEDKGRKSAALPLEVTD